MGDLAARIQRLEDVEAIRQLTSRYAHAIDQGWDNREVDADAMSTIFSSDAHYGSRDLGLSAGSLLEITASLRQETERVEFSMHSFTNPLVQVEGDSATGRWLLWICSQLRGTSLRQVFMSADFTYTRTADGWRIQQADLALGKVWHQEVK